MEKVLENARSAADLGGSSRHLTQPWKERPTDRSVALASAVRGEPGPVCPGCSGWGLTERVRAGGLGAWRGRWPVGGRGGGGQRERLFAGVAQLLSAVAARSAAGVALVVEDVHWADSETLDCLTFLGRAGWPDAVQVVVTCRSDEAPLEPQVAEWLAL